ncbi:NADPH-dependent FMN reductase [Metabacillus malikii]|uniref:FMN reductase n=1 Tax=Metabacillus malikii TaxID=1504265 RepID=A0ABT9ZCW3_9BACI|nr:NADPH-dependent FMN reductase [Metabacillus malikii]MDQ0230110.1 FMN reductase [Metabacillus malikii]
MSKVVIITGEPNETSRLYGILNFVRKVLQENDIPFKTISVHTLPAEEFIRAKFDSVQIIQANKLVEASSGVIVLTPVYKAAYSGILKTFLDLLPQKSLKEKVVLPLVIGGSIGHLLAIEYALNPVLSAIGATQFVNGVYTVDKQIVRLEQHQFTIHEEAQQRLNEALNSFMNQLK